MTKLILIRHGETDYNLQRRYSGILDIELNAHGRQHALLLQKRLEQEVVDACYSSDRKRAKETASIVLSGREAVIVPELREINFGVFEGLTHQEIMAKYKDAYVEWLKDPYAAAIPGGEKLPDFQARIAGALDAIVTRHPDKTIAVVSHGGAISSYLNGLMKRRAFWEFIPKGASFTVVEYENGEALIRIVNDYAHLGE